MKLYISVCNAGGELDSRTVSGEDEESAGKAAKAALLEMLEDVPYLAEKDHFVVSVIPD